MGISSGPSTSDRGYLPRDVPWEKTEPASDVSESMTLPTVDNEYEAQVRKEENDELTIALFVVDDSRVGSDGECGEEAERVCEGLREHGWLVGE